MAVNEVNLGNTRVRRKKITDYQPDDANANAGTERGLDLVETSLQAVGPGRSLVADKNGVLVAGNKTQEAAVNAGLTEVIEVETDGDAIIVHRRRDYDLNDTSGAARQYAYLDNRASQVSLSWDAAQIAADLQAGVDLSEMFTPDELLDIVGDFTKGQEGEADSVTIPQMYAVMIECATEKEQLNLLAKLQQEGLKCRAILS